MESDSGQAEVSLLAFFGTRVRKEREARGWSQAKLAEKIHTSAALISYIEKAKRVPTADLARDLDGAFGTDFFVGFYPLVIRYAYPSWFLPFIELEAQAARLRVFESQIIPGLLQTEDYARAMLMAVRPDNLDDLVAARMTRQAIFERPEPPQCWFILDEQALRRCIGGPQIMAAQLERLLSAGKDPRTVIQVVPDEVPAHPGLAGPFTLLAFEHETKGSGTAAPKPPHDVLHVDGFSQGRTALDSDEVNEGARAYDLLRSYALSPEASADRINKYVERLKER
ncbi:helix-turn-helix domain-containing protein [Streptomyces sp. 4F14]|uniref:helix-turn-helix domain-containing protein n=1 Tax=Streptomyces sp. 4F14 TaxID=3394380 RepID=UPI003A86B667